MTLAELIAAFRGLPPEDQRLFLAEVSGKRRRGRRPKPDAAKVAEARVFIGIVEAKRAELGCPQAAYQALATPRRTAESVKTKYLKAKRIDVEDWINNEFNEFAKEG